MLQRSLIIMVKEPRPGRVKTRLGRDIGMVSAAWWFRHQTKQLFRRLDDPRWQIYLAVSPDAEGLRSRVWPAGLPRLPQGQGDLGARMVRALRSVPIGPACVIGADIPGITRELVWEAFTELGHKKAVFGPAPDGGYWLTGFAKPKNLPPSTFGNVRWSSQFALEDSIASLQSKGTQSIGLVKELGDVDTLADLKQLERLR